MMAAPRLTLGTRGSPLALAQAEETKRRLIVAHPELAEEGAVAIAIIKTTGDHVLDRPLSEIGGKGLFTKEIEEALLDGRIDIAVHSLKDVATILPDGLVIDGCLPREDARDAFFSNGAASLAALPAGAVVGTASLRRQALVKAARPDLRVVSLRGTVQTRLAKLQSGVIDATLLAMAGLNRLGLADRATGPLSLDEMLPAVAQGAIALQCRAHDEGVRAYITALACSDCGVRVAAERALLARLDGSCRTPIAAHAVLEAAGAGQQIWLRGLIAMPDGTAVFADERRGPIAEAVAVGDDLGRALRSAAGPMYAHMMDAAAPRSP